MIILRSMSHDIYHADHKRSISWIIISRLIGLGIFLIIVAFLNAIESPNEVFRAISDFLTSPLTIGLVFTFSFLFLIGEIFFALDFPLSLPAPFFNALGSVFLISFLLQLFYLVDGITRVRIFSALRPLESLIFFFVFLIVLIVQYVNLFSRESRVEEKKSEDTPKTEETTGSATESSPPEKSDYSWDDVGAEFRRLLYDSIHNLREGLKK
ncbi:MAG: hypothetical protein LUQ17_03715 [Methanomicrobiales archaeon]|nr:hypothetical protein [Methanomicrobiales archaeon]